MLTFRRLICLAALTLIVAGCAKPTTQAPPPLPETQTPPPAVHTPPPEPKEPPVVHARILAVGDLLMHTPLVYSSQIGEDQWDFTPLFEPVRPWIEGADLAVANLETTLTGKDYPWSGYPSFNTPPDFARDVKAVGFDALTNANNHALDYDQPGINNTNAAMDRAGLPHTGASRSPEEQERIMVLPVTPEINLALLAYTAHTNWLTPAHPWSLNLMEAERVKADVKRARQLPGVDLVALALHFGDEYAREPNEHQEFFVNLALEAGADIILGNHPHVIQKIQRRQVRDEFGRDLPRAVIFSLGNFISNQVGLTKEAGLMFVVDVKKEKGMTTIEEISFVPTWVHGFKANGQKRYRVVSVEKAMKDYESGADPLITAADYARLKEVWADTTVQAVGGPGVSVLRLDRTPSVARSR